MKFFFDFIPLLFFGIVYLIYRDIFLSTVFLLIGVSLQIGYEFLLIKKVSNQTRIVFLSTIILGGSTIIFKDEKFLFWKPTIINWSLSILLIGSQIFMEKNILHKTLGSKIILEDKIWWNLSLGWGIGFFIAGLINLLVAFNFSIDFWVGYKFFGGIVITILYLLISIIYLLKTGNLKNFKN